MQTELPRPRPFAPRGGPTSEASMKQRSSWMKGVVVRVLAVAAILLGLTVIDANAGVRLKKTLAPTVANPSAQGQATVAVSGRGRRSKGKLKVKARGLAPQKMFTVRVAGVPIGSLISNRAGNGHARFSTSPGRADQPLGVDPRGQRLEVSDDQGEDELETDMPDDNPEPCCCMEDDQGENEGEEEDSGACQAAGGTVPGADSCLPDPCNDDGVEIRCCIPDSDGAYCGQTTAAECSDEHGINLGAGACDPNPCAPPPTVDRHALLRARRG